MQTLEQVEEAARNLPPEALTEFREWFARFDAETWDRQLDQDIAERKLNDLGEQASRDARAGRCTDL
jgi:hypothetical protein